MCLRGGFRPQVFAPQSIADAVSTRRPLQLTLEKYGNGMRMSGAALNQATNTGP